MFSKLGRFPDKLIEVGESGNMCQHHQLLDFIYSVQNNKPSLPKIKHNLLSYNNNPAGNQATTFLKASLGGLWDSPTASR